MFHGVKLLLPGKRRNPASQKIKRAEINPPFNANA